MNWKGRALVVVAGLLAVALAACGGSSGSETPSSPGGAGGEPGSSAPNAGKQVVQDTQSTESSQLNGASLDRKIIQTATLRLVVGSVDDAFHEAGRLAAGAGGFVATSTFSNEGDHQTATITIRVPADRFQDVLASLRGMAKKVEKEQSDATDATQEYSDLGARLRNLQATESQYLVFLNRANNINEVLQVQDRLNTVRGDIESVQTRMNLLQGTSDMATITATLAPEAAAGGGIGNPLDVAVTSFHASLATLRGLAIAVVAVAAYTWWLVPVWIALALIARRVSTRAERLRQTKQ